jgi:glycosyltransferase involved in cell wall biosynthesis
VSVVIPTWNRARLVPRAVASALANVEAGDEVIVVDDGSTDDTVEALAPYRNNIRLLRGDHAGAGAARNRGVAAARRDLVAFLDSDDEWMPDKLALQKSVFRVRPDVLFCFSDFAARDAGGEHRRFLSRWRGDSPGWEEVLGPGVPFSSLGDLPRTREDFSVHTGSLYLPLMLADCVATFTVAVRRAEAGPALRFAEDVPTFEDQECFGRLSRAGLAAYLDCETAWQHGHAGPRLTDANAYAAASARLKILERLWGADTDFLARHGEAYARRRAEQYRLRARWLLCRGRTPEARADLRLAGSAPLLDRVLARLPGLVVGGLFGLRRVLKGQAFSLHRAEESPSRNPRNGSAPVGS